MSSKFFTWTKGDRKNAAETLRSGGVIPIPVECISFKGLDVNKSPKLASTSKRSSSDSWSKGGAKPSGSFAFHDAAVQSATSLMAVMNDMLRSPPLSAHLSQRSGTLHPGEGRPRSHTAPSTPLCEAAPMEPFELPGSTPEISLSHTPSQSTLIASAGHSKNAILGYSIERPHTSPQSLSSRFPEFTHPSSESLCGDAAYDSSLGKSSRNTSLDLGRHSTRTSTTGPKLKIKQRPSLSALQTWPSTQFGTPPSTYTQQWSNIAANGHSQNVPPSQVEGVEQEDVETTLLSQIGYMRATHDAHLSSLKDAHEKEVASHLSYIAFLEKRNLTPRPLALTTDRPSKHNLTLDTSQTASRPVDLAAVDVSATTLQSFETALDSQKRTSQEAVAEVESLRRKLSLCRKEQTESVEIRRDRDQLKDALERSDRRILQLKDIVRKAKEDEKAQKNALDNLESRLATSNSERVDVLEGFHDACATVERLSKNGKEMAKENHDLRRKLNDTSPSPFILTTPSSDRAHDNSKLLRARSDLRVGAWDKDPLVSQVRELRQMLVDKDTTIAELERKKSGISTATHNEARFNELQATLDQQERALAKAEEDRDRYNSLLFNELRRQSRAAIEKAHNTTPVINSEASASVQRKMATIKNQVERSVNPGGSRAAAAAAGNAEATISALEKELEYCLQEIIMYKLDIRGYKKDMKKLYSEIETLRESHVRRPPTPRGSTSSAENDGNTTGMMHQSANDGLGISLPQPPRTPTMSTPTKTIASATVDALLGTITPGTAEKTSPAYRPKTPLGTHKRLPKPPYSRTPSPLPAFPTPQKEHQTFRSLSESVLSSYAKKVSPETGAMGTPNIQGRDCTTISITPNSEPLRSGPRV